jgi:hypothetical protein
MPAFAEEFDRRFRDARQRVSSETDRRKRNAKAPSAEATKEFTSEISLNDFHAYMPMHQYTQQVANCGRQAASIPGFPVSRS